MQPRVAQQCMNIGGNGDLGCRVIERTDYLVSFVVLAAFAVASECFAETAPAKPAKALFEQVNVNNIWPSGIGADMPELANQWLTDPLSGLVSLPSPVSPESEPMPKAKADEKSESAKHRIADEGAEQGIAEHLTRALLWFLVGVALGGGFGEIRLGRGRLHQSADKSGASR